MAVEVLIEAPEWEALGLVAIAERASNATLLHLGLEASAFEISVLGCTDARIAELNGDFRDKPRPTNVLSWPSEERAAETRGARPEPPALDCDPELGDIAIAYETCAREAGAQGLAIDDHATHLMVHATLHLLGYDHETEPDAALMERTEVEILASLGLPDPYS